MPNEQAEKACATSDEYNCVLKFLINQRYQVTCKSRHEESHREVQSLTAAFMGLSLPEWFDFYSKFKDLFCIWKTDGLRWHSYDASHTATIEVAHAQGEYYVEISIDQGSTPTCVIYFHNQYLRQVILRTQWKRTVRRYVNGKGSTVVWKWWKLERTIGIDMMTNWF